jgi:hypothetical protein
MQVYCVIHVVNKFDSSDATHMMFCWFIYLLKFCFILIKKQTFGPVYKEICLKGTARTEQKWSKHFFSVIPVTCWVGVMKEQWCGWNEWNCLQLKCRMKLCMKIEERRKNILLLYQ